MDKQEYLKSLVTRNDAKKYSFGLQRKNHLVCQKKLSLIYMLEVVFNGINNNLHKFQNVEEHQNDHHKVQLSKR